MNDEIIKSAKAHSQNCKWFMSNYCKIKEQHRGKYVAVYEERIIDSNVGYKELKKRLDKTNLDLNAVFKMYIPEGNGYLMRKIILCH